MISFTNSRHSEYALGLLELLGTKHPQWHMAHAVNASQPALGGLTYSSSGCWICFFSSPLL